MGNLLREPRPGKIVTSEKRKTCSIRPATNAELEHWQQVARAQSVSLHGMLLYLVRKGVKEIEAGEIEIPLEDRTVTQIKMP
jgi:hypothetical protein